MYKRYAAQAKLNRSKNPILISPAWIVSFVALEIYGWSFLFFFRSLVSKRRRRVKKLDNEKHIPTYNLQLSKYLHLHLRCNVCGWFVPTLCVRIWDTCEFHIYYTCVLRRMTCNQRHTITRCHLNYILKALFTSCIHSLDIEEKWQHHMLFRLKLMKTIVNVRHTFVSAQDL